MIEYFNPNFFLNLTMYYVYLMLIVLSVFSCKKDDIIMENKPDNSNISNVTPTQIDITTQPHLIPTQPPTTTNSLIGNYLCHIIQTAGCGCSQGWWSNFDIWDTVKISVGTNNNLIVVANGYGTRQNYILTSLPNYCSTKTYVSQFNAGSAPYESYKDTLIGCIADSLIINYHSEIDMKWRNGTIRGRKL